ncbi:hypothetical protein I7I53_09298 [Histoplasma capsulatum var. duboisii H88]|uniref:Uncharacterized protein n=1 Tax=Ajellomyces capsulatus (strain H88) TaxID=544711 RepID=A0A8A1L8E3_AJEC8|nr:hypothetical protein I7I53_09298 [Histoplasma capsulatum var. duboisii H88]
MLNSVSSFIFNSWNSQILYLLLDQIQIKITIKFLCQDLELVPGVSIKEREQSKIKVELQDQDMVVLHVTIFLSV